MSFRSVIAGVAGLFISAVAFADLEPWEDYEVSEAVYSVTTVKVDSNMGDAYLEGLRETWIPGNKIAMELGQIEDWKIYRSDLPESGDFNLLLVVKFANTEDLAPNKAEYEKFMKAFTKASTGIGPAELPEIGPCSTQLITAKYIMRRSGGVSGEELIVPDSAWHCAPPSSPVGRLFGI